GAPGAGGDPMPFGGNPNGNAAPYGSGAGVPPRPSRFGPSGYEGHVDGTRQSRRDRLFGPLTNWWQDRRR
ncbi:hypothetical protein ABZ914_49990, partial [Spirillospora sp. NPDC046719]